MHEPYLTVCGCESSGSSSMENECVTRKRMHAVERDAKADDVDVLQKGELSHD